MQNEFRMNRKFQNFTSCLFSMKVEEEEHLIAELKKIELRKKEREKKTQDLQKLITAADSNIDSKKADKKKANKKIPHQQKIKEPVGVSGLSSLWGGNWGRG